MGKRLGMVKGLLALKQWNSPRDILGRMCLGRVLFNLVGVFLDSCSLILVP